ncbi:MAG: sigma-70 family RNA polymerase sigma factor [Solirubrobacterales bacterium]|nr:sigma-70 family RNA polymerase sigma factor [Solirubrobacterales bacterium]
MTEHTLARARAGDAHAFRELTDPYRRELQAHIYRIVGSAQDTEDLLQETLLAAWRGLERFQERASARAWLYRIATIRSLDALRASRRRPEELQRLSGLPEPTRYGEAIWVEPYPDVLLEGIPDAAPGPEARYEAREAIALAFIVGLQHLPPQQSAVLVLRDVLGFRASESARCLTPPSHRSTASCAAHVRHSSRASRPRAGSAAELQARPRRRRPIHRSHRDGRHRRRGRPADRRRLADDAARAVRVPGPGRDRRVPMRPRGPTRGAATRTHARERPAGVRRLLPHASNRDRATVRNARPHAGERPNIRDHMVRRHRLLPALRTPANSAVGRRRCAR